MYVFSCGMHRSGSTWQYLVVSHLVETKKGGQRLGLVNNDDEFQKVEKSFRKSDAWQALKMHSYRAGFGQALTEKRALGIYSYRDLRDVVFSLIQMRNITFEEFVIEKDSLAQLVETDKMWRAQPGVLTQSYAEIVEQAPACVAAIARHLQIELAPGEANQIAQQFSKEENKKRAESWATEMKKPKLFGKKKSYDPVMLIHWNHIQSGETGYWRRLASPEQLQHLGRLCGAWLIERGFEKNMDWVNIQAAKTK